MNNLRILLIIILAAATNSLLAQTDTLETNNKERLDFARGIFELGVTYVPGFEGKRLINGELSNQEHSPSLNTTFYWGAFHFWGHAEFYVSFPLNKLDLNPNETFNAEFYQYNVTGARYYPWAVRDKKLRPYVGLSWTALDFKQVVDDIELPEIQKNFTWNADLGFVYQYKKFAGRLGINYFNHNKWDYALSKSQFTEIKTPRFNVQLGILYTTDFTKNNGDTKINDRWNQFEKVSNLGLNATSFGDFFIAAGPSLTFSLTPSQYNKSEFPFFSDSYSSNSYFDIAVGYQFNKLSGFAALTFRNPEFEQIAFDVKQNIKKTSLTLEAVKFVTDYSGFAPFVGVNIAMDKIDYFEQIDDESKRYKFTNIEPGLTFGWDIVPGKSEEFLILRTNLRWYPFSSFEIEGKKFDFDQLEYNLIQAIFYPQRFVKSRKSKKKSY